MNKFAFIIHPIEIGDFHKSLPILKNAPDFLISTMGRYINPFKISEIKGINTPRGEVEGYLIGLPFTLEQIEVLPQDIIVNKYIRAGKLAQELGVNIIGLEPYSFRIPELSHLIGEKIPLPITIGTTYSLLSAISGIKKVVGLLGKDFKECDVSIIGVDNTIGGAVAKIVAKEVKYLTLVSSNKSYLESLEKEILVETGTAVHITDKLENVIKSREILIIASNQEYKNIDIDEVKANTIICDLSRPKILTRDLENKRKDILFIDGGLIKLPFGIDLGFDYGYSPNMCSPALAETILLTIEEKYQSFSLGQVIDMDKVNTINNMAKNNGFTIGGVTNYYKELQI